MRKILHTVTVTGADDGTPIHRLAEIQREYPFVEFGLLYSRKNSGELARYPSIEWLKYLTNTRSDTRLRLSLHLCGSMVKDVLALKTVGLNEIWDKGINSNAFRRIQINTHGEKQKFDKDELEDEFIKYWRAGYELIIQQDNVNPDLVELAKNTGHSVLFDLSHGAGILPKEWPVQLQDVDCGYAGGLSPENVAEELEKIEKMIAKYQGIWIDAETKLRSDIDDSFDLDNVVKFLEAAKPYVFAHQLKI